MRSEPRRHRRGFTLVELLVVIMIIGILMALILVASAGAAREAESRATQTTIAKLDAALNDRIEALLAQRIDPLGSHQDMAMVYAGGAPLYTLPPDALGNILPDYSQVMPRAQVIALFDLYKAEIPDVFFVMNAPVAGYPLNFGSQPFPNLPNAPPGLPYYLPLGVGRYYSSGSNQFNVSPTGIFGASFTTHQAMLGATNLAAHRHKTARSEALYAMLINGKSQFGSQLNPDDFTSKEVGDTDGDGLPEFLDAWGEPLYFYRWPLLWNSDTQRGTDPPTLTPVTGPYKSVFETREQDPLDPNQYLTSVAWWSISNSGGNGMPTGPGTRPLSGPAFLFQLFFHQLTEPLAQYAPANPAYYWDRGANTAYSPRRAFFSRPLIASSGPDRTLGIPVLTDALLNQRIVSGNDTASATLELEGQAGLFDLPNRITNQTVYGGPLTPLSATQLDHGQDDITNQSLQATGGSSQ